MSELSPEYRQIVRAHGVYGRYVELIDDLILTHQPDTSLVAELTEDFIEGQNPTLYYSILDIEPKDVVKRTYTHTQDRSDLNASLDGPYTGTLLKTAVISVQTIENSSFFSTRNIQLLDPYQEDGQQLLLNLLLNRQNAQRPDMPEAVVTGSQAEQLVTLPFLDHDLTEDLSQLCYTLRALWIARMLRPVNEADYEAMQNLHRDLQNK